ncbi:MAG: dephospho-CoA kinase [Deltaproteobacteria bacterium RBG_13_49_15]|nr:MAG: dephospho-CoA kinase [Deltaproteobacteria bacterium RBG_13_49_15]
MNRSKPLTVAVTGNAGSGKTRVCRRFKELGASVIDLDILARESVAPQSPVYQEVLKHFGDRIVDSSGNLDRGLLRSRAIRDKTARKQLESIIHPEITRRMIAEIEKASRSEIDMVIVEVPLLFEVGMERTFDLVILVMSIPETEIDRIVKRDRITEEDARLLLEAQMPDDVKKDRSDFIITNTGSDQELMQRVDQIYKKLQNYLKNR